MTRPGERLIWKLGTMTVELHLLKSPSCLITGGKGQEISKGGYVSALINPANRSLSGTALPYFPRGGPVPRPPPPGLSNSLQGWGGMEAGPNMLYPSQVCDGVVCHNVNGASGNKKLSNGCWEIRNQPTFSFYDDHSHLLCSRTEHRNTNFRNWDAR